MALARFAVTKGTSTLAKSLPVWTRLLALIAVCSAVENVAKLRLE